tara:strand:- start:699 stop:1955 length:1257 start_codon:yes stop_codon:yes gene_type:complete
MFHKKLQIYYRLFISLFFLSNLNAQNKIEFDYSSINNEEFFWIQNNNYGFINSDNLLNISIKNKVGNINYLISLSNGYSGNESFTFGETFIDYHINKNIYLIGGKYYRKFSLYLNDRLSSGSLLISNNARPIPRIGIGGNKKLPMNEKVEFDWGISHGFLKKTRFYSDAPYLHEKFVYLKSSFKSRVKFGVGFVHTAIWAGTTIDTIHNNNPGDQPDSLKNFLKVFIAADGPLLGNEPHANALGSHNGIWDFYIESNFNTNKLKFYYQHYFEDTSSLRFANKTDGLWGIELNDELNNNIFLIEFLNTTNCCLDPPYQNDIYYWNYQYNDGWRYKDLTIGNPFINRDKMIEKSKIVHIGLVQNFYNNSISLKVSKKINVNDILRYKIEYEKNFGNFLGKLILVGNEYSSSFGFGAAYSF